MTDSINYVEIAARQSIAIPSKLAVHLSNIKNLDDLQGFLDDVAAAEASAQILVDTELHSAAIRRLERLGFGPADYTQSKQIMLGVMFSPEVSSELGVDAEELQNLAA
jgi:hypothetical protein